MKLFSFLILSIIWLQSCEVNSDVSTFKILDSKSTGLNFSNDLVSTTEFNILSYLYFYNGGGVAIGDVNNDGLPDIYLCGNQVDDKLFINDGDFKFTDISHLLPENDIDGWSTGVTMVDINHDGFLDIYVCKLGLFKSLNDSNKLFINDKGVGFSEQASAYNLNFSGLCTQSAFLDYDRDGDLDCYLLNHSIKDPSQFKPSSIRMLTDSISGDKLLENQEGKFVDVTKESNIYSSNIGFGLGIDVSDVNNDGWLDIYVGNDFHEQDYLYINQGDKTFKESIELSTGHISNFSMGCSLVDLNNEMNDAHRKEFERRQTSGWQSDEEDGESEKPPYNDEGEIVVSAQEMQRMENERHREKDKIDEEEMKRIEMEEKDVKIPLSVFQRDDGGFWGMNADGTPNNEIYYVGIIDILQQYNMIKFTENKWKSWFGSAGATKISALPPKKYARRFIEFITGSIK